MAIRTPVELDFFVSPIVNTGNLQLVTPQKGAFFDNITQKQVTSSSTNNYPPSYPSQNSTAISALSYKNDFYFKIRYLPDELNLGALTSAQVRQLYVFNGFFAPVTLEQLVITNATGINISGPATPTIYPPLALSQYEITVDVDGPATIDSTLTFDFAEPTEDRSVTLKGTRLVAYPFLFANGMRELLEWKTQVITSNDGTEQRVRIRNAPRQSFRVDSFVPGGNLSLSDSILYGWRSNVWGVPVFQECRNIESPTSTASTTINVLTNNAEFREGELAIIYENQDSFEVVQIESFTANTIEARQNISRVFSTRAIVCPVIPCRMISSPRRSTSGHNARISAAFQSIKNVRLPTTDAPTQYKNLDVFLDEPLTSNGSIPDVYDSRVDTIDYQSSNLEIFSTWSNTKIARSFELQFDNQEQLWNFRLWLHRREGKQRPFWMPTFESNFRLVSTGLIGAQLTVVNDGQLLYGQNRVNIAVKHSGGWAFAGITNFSSNGNNIDIDLDQAVGVDASEIEYISYIGQKRLGSDNISINHGGNFVSSVNLPIVEVSG